ncbi:MAG: PKD domain-containing protein [Patescibacteria group bacterium]|nr:PKD domain-containing protein [Patescibacteria group bacterium]
MKLVKNKKFAGLVLIAILVAGGFIVAAKINLAKAMVPPAGSICAIQPDLCTGVANQPPVADFTWLPLNPVVGQIITFDGSASSDPDGTIAAYLWDSDDAMYSTSITKTHAFTTAGTHQVFLTVTDNLGASTTIEKDVVVTVLPLVPAPPLLKDLGYTTAETLLFTPSATKTIRQWSLLKGVAAVAISGTNNWQKSAAEVLYIGSVPVAHITKTGDHYLAPGDSTEYTIHFDAVETNRADGLYSAVVTDTITAGSQIGKITINSATITPTSIDPLCSGMPISGTTGIDNTNDNTNKKVTFIFASPNLVKRGCSFELKVGITLAEDIAANTTITDTARIELPDEGANATAVFTTLSVGPFTQETVGGDIYSKGNLNFGQLPTGQYGGKYVLGSGGDIQTLSEQNWLLSGYGVRSGSTADFSPDACTVSGSVCKAMNDNIVKLKRGANTTKLFSGSVAGTFDLNPNKIPEGGVFYKSGNLTIGGYTTLKGKGTIIVENGNLTISGDMVYDTTTGKPSILGIIVKNGNVIVDPGVKEIDAIFYIFSDKTAGQVGSFITNSNGTGSDIQLKIKGAVIASGYGFFDATILPAGAWVRKDAFVLGRNYIGTIAGDGTLIPAPAELFQYDSRIIVTPPPGFGGKILGNM